MSKENIKDKLDSLLYCVDGMKEEHDKGNHGEVNEWLRHVLSAASDYQEALDED